MAKIYISSTYLDLQEHRRQVSLVLRRLGHEDVAMEYYVAEDQRPVGKCLSDVTACDLFIGIYAWRYGWVPSENNPAQLSITEMEYRQAEKIGKPCFIFLLNDEAPWPRKSTDKDTTQIEKLRNEAGARHSSGPTFKSVDELGRLVAESIHKWEKDQGRVIGLPIPELDAYYSILQKRYGRLDLDALTPPQKEEYLQLQLRSVFVEQSVRENPPPVELPKEMWEKLQRDRDVDLEDFPEGVTLEDVRRTREAYYEKASRPVLEVLADSHYQHVIILGDPGSGKSTLARYVLLSLIDSTGDEKVRRVFDGYLPLLIELRSYAGLCADNKCETFLEFFEYLGKTEGWHLTQTALHNHLKNDGRAVVIFDGLDEIFDPEERERITRQIVGFASDYSKAHILVTSRVIGYRRKILEDAGFTHFTLQDLDETQVATFVDRWYGLALSDRPEEAKERRERIMRSFKESASIRQLAGNPMLLTIMAIIGKHQELPRERWKLYDHAASVLIQHWDVNKHLKDQRVKAEFIGEEDKKELLRRLAFKMQGGAGGLAGNYIHREQLQAEFEAYLKERYSQTPDRAKIVAEKMIQQFRERNFILSLYGANMYSFVHRAFLEYFCATVFVYKFEKTHEISSEQLKHEVYGKHWEDQSWHEVLCLICGMLDEKFAGEIIEYLANEAYKPWPGNFSVRFPLNIFLAAQCLCEVRNLSIVAEPAKELLLRLCHLIDYFMTGRPKPEPEKLRGPDTPVVESIGSNWPRRSLLAEWLKQRGSFNRAWSFDARFGKFVGLIGQGLEEVHLAILDYANHDDKNYRVLAPRTLAIGWHDDPQTLTLLRKLAVDDPNEYVRVDALSTLVIHFQNDPQTLTIVHDRIVNDIHEKVRSVSVDKLADHFHDDPKTLPLLHDRAVNDIHEWVRANAVSSLARRFSDDPQTFPVVCNSALHEIHDWVRRRAVSVLAQNFRDDPQSLSIVTDRAVNDTHRWVRIDAITALAKHFRDDPQILPLTHSRLFDDTDSVVRSMVVSALSEHFRDDLQTLSLLHDLTINHSENNVRRVAVFALGEYFYNEPRTFDLLCHCLFNDTDEYVHLNAVTAIAKHFGDNSKTISLLREWAFNAPHDIRAAALTGLVQFSYSNADIMKTAKDLTINSPYDDVREATVSALAEHFCNDPEIFLLVHNRALNDLHEDVRAAAVRALSRDLWDNSKSLSAIHDRAINDVHETVRSAAISSLKPEFGDARQHLPILHDRVINDNHQWVRRTCIYTLAQHFRSDPETLKIMQDRVINDAHEQVRTAAVTSIAQHFRKNPEIFPLLRDWATNSSHPDVRSAAVSAIGEYNRSDPQSLSLLLDRARNDDYTPSPEKSWKETVRYSAILALASFFRDEREIFPMLHDWAINSSHPDVRRAALSALAEQYRNEHQTLPLVRDRAINDSHNWVRTKATSVMAQYFCDDSQTLPSLQDWVINSVHEDVRSAAVFALVKISRNDLKTLAIVRDCASKDVHEDVRRDAIFALAEYFRNDPQTFPLLRDYALKDQQMKVRRAAVSSMAKYFRTNSETLPLLCDWAINSSLYDVRAEAVSALAEYFCVASQSLPLVRDRAIKDSHEDVRKAAVIALTEHFRMDSQTLSLLCERAINDESPSADAPNTKFYVREKAINALAEYWPTHPDTLPLLRERVENDPTPWLREKAKELVARLSGKLNSNLT